MTGHSVTDDWVSYERLDAHTLVLEKSTMFDGEFLNAPNQEAKFEVSKLSFTLRGMSPKINLSEVCVGHFSWIIFTAHT